MSHSVNQARRRLSMKDGALHAGCSQRYLYDLADKGEIPTYMAAGHRWVDQEDIDAYFERQKAKGPQYRVIGYGARATSAMINLRIMSTSQTSGFAPTRQQESWLKLPPLN